jgi:Cof-subfamily: Cof-like hydrolase
LPMWWLLATIITMCRCWTLWVCPTLWMVPPHRCGKSTRTIHPAQRMCCGSSWSRT